jgi:bacteriochlorophyll 4-vinyl reductase
MTEPGIARILVASLHEGISDLLPARLDFYENWLHPDGLRLGTIGLAPVLAVLSFLRQEGEPYHRVTRRAGEYTAEWTVASQSPVHRSLLKSLPPRLRSRAVLRLARRTIQGLHVGQRVRLRIRRGQGAFDVRDSVFCTVRERSNEPLCTFHTAVVSRLLELYSVPGEVRLDHCRAIGDPSCLITVTLRARRPSRVVSVTSPE